MPFWLKILVSVIAVEILGGLGAVFTTSSIETWYAELTKPPGNPPNWLFAPVWTALYALIGIAFARVWHLGEAGPRKQAAMTWFTIQLVLNLAWTPVFFGAHQKLAALVIILTLVMTILLTMRAFARIDPLAAGLLCPYVLWVGYASYLNAGLWWLNR